MEERMGSFDALHIPDRLQRKRWLLGLIASGHLILYFGRFAWRSRLELRVMDCGGIPGFWSC
jgi:hypothetical protein